MSYKNRGHTSSSAAQINLRSKQQQAHLPKMKFLVIAIAFLACAYADVSELAAGGYDYPAPPAPVKSYIPPPPPPPPPAPKNTYIPPPAAPAKAYIPPPPPPPPPAPKNTYIPPAPAPVAPVETYIPPAPAPAPAYIPPAPVQAEEPIIEEIEQPAQDGYRYKTVRRRVFRHRN
ncbi:leucine-rich repeat extensin-like protein 3 [Drosophila erecta]|nr:leucine-rich repeat extensin-like protein 3 [Drosophila erecta]